MINFLSNEDTQELAPGYLHFEENHHGGLALCTAPWRDTGFVKVNADAL
jgi:hypothetical protein